MDEKTLSSLREVVEAAYKNATTSETFLKMLTNGLKKLKDNRVISGFDLEQAEEHVLILTVTDNDGQEHKFGLEV